MIVVIVSQSCCRGRMWSSWRRCLAVRPPRAPPCASVVTWTSTAPSRVSATTGAQLLPQNSRWRSNSKSVTHTAVCSTKQYLALCLQPSAKNPGFVGPSTERMMKGKKKPNVGLQVGQGERCAVGVVSHAGEAPVTFVTSQGADSRVLKGCRLLPLCGMSSSKKDKQLVSHLDKTTAAWQHFHVSEETSD